MSGKLTIYTDGAARGNPGPSASGFMAYREGSLVHRHFEYNAIATNNYAEYKAVLLALRWCASSGGGSGLSIELYSDNELVVRQLRMEYKIKSKALKPLNDEIKDLANRFKGVVFKNVPRENMYIAAVDRALNELLDRIQKSGGKEKA